MTTEQMEAELGPDVCAIIAEPWRLLPHTFAAEVELQSAGGPFKRTRLADFLCESVADAVMATGARLIINVGPRQGKSESVSFACMTWFLEHFPKERAIFGTHTASLSLEYGRRIRNEFAQNPKLTTELQDDAQAANQWNTTEGGGLKTIGVGGALFGFGGKLVIVDDPHKGWVEAQSWTERQNVINWFEGTLMNRLEPGASVIVIMHRLHRDDLTGYLVRNSKEPWKLLTLPAIARAGDLMGRAPGEPVCPERFGLDEMLAKRAAMPHALWASMYDQDPDEAREGRTYSNYSSENVSRDITLRHDLPVFATFDFNVNPGMHCEIGQSDTRADKIVFRHEVFAPRMKTPACAKAVADKLKAIGGGKFPFPKLIVYGDRSGKTETTHTTDTDYVLIGQQLRENGIERVEFHVPNANPPVKARVAAMNDALCDSDGERHLFVHPDCTRLINDLENVQDGEDGMPDKGDTDLSHSSDASGYAVVRIRPIRQAATPQARVSIID